MKVGDEHAEANERKKKTGNKHNRNEEEIQKKKAKGYRILNEGSRKRKSKYVEY